MAAVESGAAAAGADEASGAPRAERPRRRTSAGALRPPRWGAASGAVGSSARCAPRAGRPGAAAAASGASGITGADPRRRRFDVGTALGSAAVSGGAAIGAGAARRVRTENGRGVRVVGGGVGAIDGADVDPVGGGGLSSADAAVCCVDEKCDAGGSVSSRRSLWPIFFSPRLLTGTWQVSSRPSTRYSRRSRVFLSGEVNHGSNGTRLR